MTRNRERLLEKKCKLAIACINKEIMHMLEDLHRLGALDKEGRNQIVSVFEIHIKREII